MTRKTKEAFKWIVRILKKHKVPFQIAGGFAARVYGSERKLNDIDIETPDDRIKEIVPDVKKYIIFGPKRCVEEGFNVFSLILEYKGEIIDVTGCNTGKFFSSKHKKWMKDEVDLSKAVKKKVFGLMAPVVPKKALIRYKKELMREVDIVDLMALEKSEKFDLKQIISNRSSKFRLKVAAVIVNNGKILLVRNKGDAGFTLPGGGVKKGETIEYALARELKEEISSESPNIKFFGTYLGSVQNDGRRNFAFVFKIKLRCKPKKGKDVAEIKWFSIKEVLAGNTENKGLAKFIRKVKTRLY